MPPGGGIIRRRASGEITLTTVESAKEIATRISAVITRSLIPRSLLDASAVHSQDGGATGASRIDGVRHGNLEGCRQDHPARGKIISYPNDYGTSRNTMILAPDTRAAFHFRNRR